jgi:AraC family transcriptional activator of pobA
MKGQDPAAVNKRGCSDRTFPLPDEVGGSSEKKRQLNDGARELHPDILKKHEMETVVLHSALRNSILRFEFHNFKNMINTVSQVNPATRLIDTNELKQKGFKVYKVDLPHSAVPTYSRRDFYKICLVTSRTMIHYADRSIELDGTFLFFGNPLIPYSTEVLSDQQLSYACLFTEDFLKPSDRTDSLQESPLFKIGGTPVLSVNDEQKEYLTSIFQKMLAEQDTDYAFKHDLIRNYLNLIIHEALKMQPSENFIKSKNAATRITTLFLDLLERQFPIDNKDHPLKLKTAQDFADRLNIHTNSLSRAVKEVTGKPTSLHITERIASEAKALLQHTDWSISDIAYSLGFEYTTYFNNFFKKATGAIPKSFRSKPS